MAIPASPRPSTLDPVMEHSTLDSRPSTLSKTRLEMIEAGGRLSQLLGLPRSIGQIYGLLYLSADPLSLDDIAELLSISKSSVSNGTRQLLGWRVINQVWIHGHRRDHFEVELDLGNLMRATYSDFIKPRLESSKKRMDRMNSTLDHDLQSGAITREEFDLCNERLIHFRQMQGKLNSLAPLIDRFL